MIIDSHGHFWTQPPLEQPELPGSHHEPLHVEELIQHMAVAGVDKLIQITRGMMGFDNSYSLEGAARYPDKIRVMGRFDAGAPDALGRLRRWRTQPHMAGIRMMTVASDEAARFTDGSLDQLWAEAERLALPIAIYAPERSSLIATIATRHPALPIIVEHIGMRVFDIFKAAPSMDDWGNFLSLKHYPNVTVKVSGMPEAMVEQYPFPKSQRRLREIYDEFGPDRMMWGSNYPPTTQICSYRQALDFIREECDFLSADDRAKLLGRTASSVLGLSWKST
jgi:predicted TIM-barrel fold metal-dependent hydrolase